MIVGCYSMDLYCANEDLPIHYSHLGAMPDGYHLYGEFPHTFDGKTDAHCRKQARLEGWKFADGDATCPRCAGSKP